MTAFATTPRRSLTDQQRARPWTTLACADCGAPFPVPYKVSATRRATPSYCSAACRKKAAADRRMKQLRGRFMERAAIGAPDQCWPWMGRKTVQGYGVFDLDRRPQVASRVMWLLTHGSVPNLHVCHKCDNPICVNPSHLWIGTPAENAADRDSKGRQRLNPLKGAQHPAAKLKEKDVLLIRASTLSGRALARRFSVTPTLIYHIRARRLWAHV